MTMEYDHILVTNRHYITILTAKVAGAPNIIGYTTVIGGYIPNEIVVAMHLAGADGIFIIVIYKMLQ